MQSDDSRIEGLRMDEGLRWPEDLAKARCQSVNQFKSNMLTV